MEKRRKNRHATEAGKRLADAIFENYSSIPQFAADLAQSSGSTNKNTVETTISQMINETPVDQWNRKYFLPIERLLGIRVADIIDGTKDYKPSPRGLYEIGTYGTYKNFEWLSEQTDGSVEIIKTYDEWSKNIVDYVYEALNFEGFRYLVDHNFYAPASPGDIVAMFHHSQDFADDIVIILKLLSKDKDPEYKMFVKLLDSREHTDYLDHNPGIFENENILDVIINSEHLLDAVCRKPDLVRESVLNGMKRQLLGEEYHALCASNWLTPLLCYALRHEKEYRNQAKRLLETSLKVADDTLNRLGKYKGILGGEDTSITTKNGHVILGHRYVIGVIGEPSTEGEIKDPELKRLANDTTAKIGSFRAMAKFQTPVIVDGKMHMPRAEHNPLYKAFIKAAKGRRYLLQEAVSNGGDAANNVFEKPAGTVLGGSPSLEQWEQIGKALKEIHKIDCGKEGLCYCHGPFHYGDFYALSNGTIELITGYRDVYLGKPEEDVFAIGVIAFKDNFYEPEPQDEIEAFLSGYGYPSEGFLEKFLEYLISEAKKASSTGETRFYMTLATSVLNATKNPNS